VNIIDETTAIELIKNIQLLSNTEQLDIINKFYYRLSNHMNPTEDIIAATAVLANYLRTKNNKLDIFTNYLAKRQKVLFICTSTRYEKHSGDIPKSTELAYIVQRKLGQDKVTVMDAYKLNIYVCEGNVSAREGNNCGVKEAKLIDSTKNPTGYHRCWASINNPTDELWKISKAIFESDVIVFCLSNRWGSGCAIYQKIKERLNWIINRVDTLKETPIIINKDLGLIITGHNWGTEELLLKEQQVWNMFGFNTPNELQISYQFSNDITTTTPESYSETYKKFEQVFNVNLITNDYLARIIINPYTGLKQDGADLK